MDRTRHTAIRVADIADGSAMGAVLKSSYPSLMAPAYDPDVLALALPGMTTANPALIASGTYYVVENPEHGIVACGGWSHETPGTRNIERGIAHIRHFATHMDWTGQGLGRRIFERCTRDALAAHVSTFTCFSSLNAEPFYRALGFDAQERVEITLGNGARCPSVVMSRRIDRPEKIGA